LSYLIARYGSDPFLDWESPAPSGGSWFSSILFPGHEGKAPRTRAVIRQSLERIVAANQNKPR